MPKPSKKKKRTGASAAAALNTMFRKAQPGGRGGGWWPADGGSNGNYENNLIGITVKKDAKFAYGPRATRIELDAFSVQFTYECDEHPDLEAGKSRKWSGQTITIPYDPSSLPESEDKSKGGKQQTRCQIAIDALLGQLNGYFGLEELESMKQAFEHLAEIESDIETARADETKIRVLTYCHESTDSYTNRQGKTTEFTRREETIKELLSGTHEDEDEEDDPDDTEEDMDDEPSDDTEGDDFEEEEDDD